MDLIWCSEVLEHLFSPLGTLCQIRRIMKWTARSYLRSPITGWSRISELHRLPSRDTATLRILMFASSSLESH
jgi:hypothetical protein